MDKIETYNSIDDFNKAFGIETLHPLVNIADVAKTKRVEIEGCHCFNFYTIFLKDVKCGDIKYGRNYYDYQDGTLVFMAPMQIMSMENRRPEAAKGWVLMFHPDLLRGTQLGRNLKDYSFFSYEVNEALHLSEQERRTVLECFRNIENELRHAMDKHSKDLIVSNLELFLSYCRRFYERQFITRSHVNSDILTRFERVLDEYFHSELPKRLGIPSAKYCADKMNFSVNYLSDLLRKDTGKSTLEHIQLRLVEAAKEKLFDTNKSISEIAYELGFEYPQYFSRLFKKRVGMTPNEYRAAN
ncbi:helix-turn-helix transcriptional regulator [Parabacteroides distasonis]|uniref:helix-turn-helix domain-containing protein n=1 Tax=Parabacteroides distasonis TaxID=823 RepID=UPI00189B01C9|nr:AraC family transcriptional regulator [Parabacteroides distasonis]MDB8998477.1 helix-turn-helix transcriptional regulator [Parabacteroides distasonis]MDB9073261.1 helix-turn-helix transcriptional regulator [Parabacteroides distasonis]